MATLPAFPPVVSMFVTAMYPLHTATLVGYSNGSESVRDTVVYGGAYLSTFEAPVLAIHKLPDASRAIPCGFTKPVIVPHTVEVTPDSMYTTLFAKSETNVID